MALDRTERRRLHETSVAGNTVAGTVGLGLGAAKLRDAYREDHPQAFDRHVANTANRALKHGASSKTVTRGVHLAQKAKPRFKSLVVAGAAGSVAAGARRLSEHEQRVKARKEMVGKAEEKKSSYDPAELRRRAHEPPKTASERNLKIRAGQALHPPEVKRQRVSSTAVHSLGYQKQTRRLAVEMHSRPGQAYTYRVPPKKAAEVLNAPSKGRAYSKQIRGQYPREPKVRVRDRARLFADPVQKSLSVRLVVPSMAPRSYGETAQVY